MKKFELVLLVMLLMPVSFAVANRHVDIKMEWREGQKTSVDPEWLKVYVDDESKSLYLNFKDSFAPITIEVKDIEKQIVFRTIIFPVVAGEYTLYLGDLSLGQYELYIYNAKLLQKSEMRKDIVIELSYKGFG
ncbi:DUF3244 domain-containing protein [Bacteroides thetaiotaomicron]|uniref:DUF3244 domain-containing protein n=1 Tax=Bacteroides thetaiotaomicron TaxID=818 RepID=UPI00216576DF|nr:DUF3244 domain-containing protein [Bacteroides thetaiotaomicron]MCS2448300.1 DUF3244 domain-containing protein [Bacteroides thetaiotaomicron]